MGNVDRRKTRDGQEDAATGNGTQGGREEVSCTCLLSRLTVQSGKKYNAEEYLHCWRSGKYWEENEAIK